MNKTESKIPETWSELCERTLDALAERTLVDPDADPALVAGAADRLARHKLSVRDAVGKLSTAGILRLREVLRDPTTYKTPPGASGETK